MSMCLQATEKQMFYNEQTDSLHRSDEKFAGSGQTDYTTNNGQLTSEQTLHLHQDRRTMQTKSNRRFTVE